MPHSSIVDGGSQEGPASYVRAYAARCREVLPEGFGVRSYAGLWLLLARLAPTTSGSARSELEEALGVGAEEAADLAEQILAEQREDLGAAVAGWIRPGAALSQTLPVPLDTLPDQAGLDTWARVSTRGRIDTFPVGVEPETVLVRASALAAETRWQVSLDVEDDRLVLDEQGLLAVVDTAAGELVAVAVPPGSGNLDVVSVVARPDLPTTQVWAAVDEVAELVLDGALLERRVPAASLSDGHAWRVTRTRMSMPASSTTTEVWGAALPAWRHETTSELTAAPGVRAVTGTVLSFMNAARGEATCVQGATATYTSDGFEAATITAMAFMGSVGEPSLERKVRRVSLRFDRPHAVIALARGAAWEGMPLVHAWVDGSSDSAIT